MALNSMQIPIKLWSPTAQRAHQQNQRASPSRYWFKLRVYRIFPLILLFNTNPVYSAPITYILPGTNYVLTHEASLNLPWLRNIILTVIKNTIFPHPSAPSVPVEKGSTTNCYCRDEKFNCAFWNSESGNSATGNPVSSNPTTDIRQTPHSFIADTDSVEICMDTGSNQVIIKDKT